MKPLNYPQASKLDPPKPLWHNIHININYYYIVEYTRHLNRNGHSHIQSSNTVSVVVTHIGTV